MKNRRSIQYTVAALCVCAALALPVYACLIAFTGEIRIDVGTAESIAVRPVVSIRGGASQRVTRFPGREIPFATPSNARGWIDENRYYDVVALPFALAVGESEIVAERQVEGTLSAVSDEGEWHMNATPNLKTVIGGYTFAVVELRPWHGLVSAPGNPAMVALTLARHDPGATPSPVYLPDRAWVRLDSNTALHFRWVESSAATQESIEVGTEDEAPARWGVVEDGRSEWLSSFQPGSGLVMGDGSHVVLIQRNEEYAGPNGPTSAVEVSVERDGESVRQWVRANDDSADSRIRYEDSSRMPLVVHVFAWEFGAVQVRVLHHGELTGDAIVERGKTWTSQEAALDIQLYDVLPAATAVRAEDSVLYEAVLQGPDRVLRIPEHEAVPYDGVTFRFTPTIEPARVRYTLATYQPGDDGPKTWQLGPEDRITIAGWELSQHSTRLTTGDSAVFRARKTVPPGVWVGGIAILAMGVLLLISARRALT